jgi:hypothetical protein
MLAGHRSLSRRPGLLFTALASSAALPAAYPWPVAQVATAQESARVGCEARDNGAPAAANFRAFRGDGQIASGICGKDVAVAPGEYQLAIELDGVLGARPLRVPIAARSGQTGRAQASFETGELLVEVARDGRRSVGMVVLYQDRAEVARMSAGVASRVAVGVYTVDVESRGELRRNEMLSIARAERRVLRIDFASTGAQPK